MSHNLEILNGVASFLYAEAIKSKVWHGLGQSLGFSSFSLEEALAHPIGARAFFDVATQETFLGDGRKAPLKAALRTDRDAILAGVGPGWTPLPEREAIEKGIKPFLREGETEIRLQSLGVLDGGRALFAQTPPIITMPVGSHGKTWEARVTVANFNYSRRCELILTLTDVVCANTLGAASASAKFEDETDEEEDLDVTGTRVRHTTNVASVFEKAAKRLAKRVEKAKELAGLASVALETNLTREEQVSIVQHLWDSTGKDGTPTSAATKAQARVLELATGRDLVGADEHNPGSAYGLYAAITQFLDREAPRRFSNEEKVNPDLASFGTYVRSALGLDSRVQDIRAEATRVLLGVS